MKKRKIKKWVFIPLLLIVVVIISSVFFSLKKPIEKKEKKIKETNVEQKIENPKEKKMSLIAVGDVLIHESVYKDAYESGTYNFHKMFEYIEPILKKYDLKYCNQESTIGGSALGISGYPAFNSPDEIGDELVNFGFNLISLANNHALDRGIDAVLYSNEFWKSKSVITAGAYSSQEERDEVKIYEKNGIKYGFLAYTTISNNKVPNNYIINMYSADRASEDISKLKGKVDVIIVSMHWGVEYTNIPTESQRQIAEYLSSLGVNLIIGSHSHTVEPIEYIGDTLVMYSLGNFISNQLSIAHNYPYEANPGIGLMVGLDIIVNDDGTVSFDNIYKELILAYAENSTNFKVIPFSKLNNDLFNNYEKVKEDYMNFIG